jgi:hypothetical protein
MKTTGETVTLSKFDFEEVLVYAERYAIGRMTYAPHTVCSIINGGLQVISTKTLDVLKGDIERETERDNLGNPSIDAPVWKKTYNNITEELSRRTIKK